MPNISFGCCYVTEGATFPLILGNAETALMGKLRSVPNEIVETYLRRTEQSGAALYCPGMGLDSGCSLSGLHTVIKSILAILNIFTFINNY